MADWDNAPDPESGEAGIATTLGAVSGHLDVATLAFSAFNATKSQASDLQGKYARLDLYRPYFDINTKDVAFRLAFSLLPKKSAGSQIRKPDLYGPIVIAFSLASLLHTSMIQNRYSPSEGTTIGLALFLSVSYVVLMTFGFKIAGALLSIEDRWEKLCVTFGYGLFGVCVPVFAKCYLHRYIGILLFPICTIASVFNVGYALAKGGTKAQLPFAASGAGLHLIFFLYVWSFTAGAPAGPQQVPPIMPNLQVGQNGG